MAILLNGCRDTGALSCCRRADDGQRKITGIAVGRKSGCDDGDAGPRRTARNAA